MKTKRDAIDFFTLVARLEDCQPATVRRRWKAIYEVIVRELYVNGVVYLPDIGYFTLKEVPAQVQKQQHPDGTIRYYEVPARDKAVFTPDDDFTNDINMIGVTKSYRQRVKRGALTLRDKERERRAKEMMGLPTSELSEVDAKELDKTVTSFEERMKGLRLDYEKRLEENMRERVNEPKQE